jgi:hypothetical protein
MTPDNAASLPTAVDFECECIELSPQYLVKIATGIDRPRGGLTTSSRRVYAVMEHAVKEQDR